MSIQLNGREVEMLRVCEECDASYTKYIQPNQEEWEDILSQAQHGVFIIIEAEDESYVIVRESYFVCQDCCNSTHMDQIDNEPRQMPEDSEELNIQFPHPFFQASFKKPDDSEK